MTFAMDFLPFLASVLADSFVKINIYFKNNLKKIYQTILIIKNTVFLLFIALGL